MKTWADIEDLLKDAPRTQDGKDATPFGLEAQGHVPDEEIVDYIYKAVKQQVDEAVAAGKKVLVRVYPELVKRSVPNADGTFCKDAYFRLATSE